MGTVDEQREALTRIIRKKLHARLGFGPWPIAADIADDAIAAGWVAPEVHAEALRVVGQSGVAEGELTIMLFAARREAAEAQATLAAVRKWRDKHYGLVPSPIDATLFAAAPSASLDAATREAAARALEEAAEQMYDARDQRMLRARAASMREGAPL